MHPGKNREYHLNKIMGRSNIMRKRGNPNWGQPIRPTPAAATEFEMEMRRLRLTSETCLGSSELKEWCTRNRNRCYIPEWVLGAWKIDVDPLSSPERMVNLRS
jgi:hypothetical protein